MHSKRVFWTSVMCVSLAACGGVDSQRKQPLVGTEARAMAQKPGAPSPITADQLPADWRFTISLRDNATDTILAQIITLGDSATRVRVSQKDHEDAIWGGAQEIWFINTAALGSLSSRTAKVFITATVAERVDGILSLPLDGGTTFAFGGLNVGQGSNKFGIGTYNSTETVPWDKTGRDPYPSDTSYYFVGPTTSNPTLGLRLVVPSSGSTTFKAVQWYEVFADPNARAPININPGLTTDSTSGVEYTVSTVPPTAPGTGGVVWSAVSELNLQ